MTDINRYLPQFRLTSSASSLSELLDQAMVHELHGHERLSQLYSFHIHVVAKAAFPYEELINAPVTIIAERPDRAGAAPEIERKIGGIVASVRDRMAVNSKAQEYVLEVVPALWLTSLTTATDVFQQQSVPEVIETILKDIYRFKSGEDYELRLKGKYPKRDFVVQYGESHLSFISRLCEHVGIFFFFEHNDALGRDVAVFGDDNGHFKAAMAENAKFLGRGEHTHIFELEAGVTQRTQAFRVRDYNYRSPHIEMAAEHTFGKGTAGVLDEYGGYFATPDEAKAVAQVRAQQSAAEFLRYEGGSDYPALRAGTTVRIEGHPAEVVTAAPLLITAVTHHAVQALGGEHDETYRSTFAAISAQTPYRPPRITPKPQVAGLVTAMVESPQKDGEKYGALDDSGRYRLNFHYDGRLNLGAGKEREPAKASLPVRMAQPSAGADRSFHFPLKHGTEVVVACVNGDPDRPVIVGAVPDLGGDKGWRGSPVTESNKEKHILRTNLSELSIDDTEGKPRWRTQVGHATHVHLMGEPEQEKLVKTRIPEKGHALASADNLTATVNKQMTFESTDYTTLQQMQTMLTAAKALSFTGEDPGWEDWKGFEQALAKAVAYSRLLEELTVKKKDAQLAKAGKRKAKAQKAHQKARGETIAALNDERKKDGEPPLQYDPNRGQSEEQWQKDTLKEERSRNDTARAEAGPAADAACAEEEKAQKEYEALVEQKKSCRKRMRQASGQQRKAEAEVRGAQRRQAKAKHKMQSRINHTERAAAQNELQSASADEQAARARQQGARDQYEQAEREMPSQAQLHEAKLKASEARKRCQQARRKLKREKRKKAALDREKKAESKRAKAEAAEHRKLEYWKAIELKTEAGKAAELTELEKKQKPKAGEEKDLWSKIAKELSDQTHEKQLDETKAALDEAKSSLSASTERDAAEAGSFQEPYAIYATKDSVGVLGGNQAFFYGDSHATLYSPKNTQLVSGDRAHLKAETGVEVATDDWIKLTSSKVIDVQCDKDIKLVADSAENKAMPGGHSMLFYSNKGINMESATGKIEGKAMKSIELTADMQGIKLTANLANIDMKATAGQIKGMGLAGIMFNTPAAITLSAAGAQTHSAAGAVTVSAGGAYTAAAGGAATVTAGGAVTIAAGAAATVGAAGLVTIAGSGLLLL